MKSRQFLLEILLFSDKISMPNAIVQTKITEWGGEGNYELLKVWRVFVIK